MSVADTLTAARPRSGRAISFLVFAIAIALIVATPFLPNYYVRVINSLLIYILLGTFQWARCVSNFRLLEADDPVHAWRARMLDAHDGLAGRAF